MISMPYLMLGAGAFYVRRAILKAQAKAEAEAKARAEARAVAAENKSALDNAPAS